MLKITPPFLRDGVSFLQIPPLTPSTMLPADEKALIEAFQSGDEFAFVSLYNRYKTQVYGFCVKMLGDKTLAQDVLQETFLRVYENRERLIKTSSFKSWVFTIARNQCLNQLRRSKRQVSLEDDAHGDPAPPVPQGQVAHLEKSEQVQLVNYFLDQLKDDYREVIILREYQNLSYAEIAAVTRSTLSAVKSRLFKARRKLASFMEPVLQQEQERVAAQRTP